MPPKSTRRRSPAPRHLAPPGARAVLGGLAAACAGLAATTLAGCGGRDLERDHVTGQAASGIASMPALVLPGRRAGQDLSLRVAYPVKRGHYPLVILAGRNGADDDSYVRLADHWASRGYVVVQLTTAEPGAAAGAADVGVVLDSLDTLEQRIPALRRSIDRARIAVAGHDAGVPVALAVADPAHEDPRVGAILLVGDPARPPGSVAGGWLDIRKPTFLLAGTHARPGYVRPAAAPLAPAGAVHVRLEVRDLDRCLGNLLCRSERGGPPDYAALTAFEDASTAFLDGYLRHDAAALAWLARADRPDLVNGRGRLTVL